MRSTYVRQLRHALLLLFLASSVVALGDGAELRRVEVEGTDQTVVRLHLSAPAVARGQAGSPRTGGHNRILVDLDGTTLAPAAQGVVAGRGALLRILPAQLDATTVRLTLELTEPLGFTVQSVDNLVTVTLAAPGPAGPGAPRVPTVRQPAEPQAPRP